MFYWMNASDFYRATDDGQWVKIEPQPDLVIEGIYRPRLDSLPDSTKPRCSDEEWRAFWRIGQIREIAEPGFARRLEIAREEGLLALLLAGDRDGVERVASECIESLSAQIRWVYPQPVSELSPPADMTNSECLAVTRDIARGG